MPENQTLFRSVFCLSSGNDREPLLSTKRSFFPMMPVFVLSVFCILRSRVQIRSVSEPLPLMRMPYLDSFGLSGPQLFLSVFSPSFPPSPSSSSPVQSLIVELSEQLKQSALEKSPPSSPSPHLSLHLCQLALTRVPARDKRSAD